MNQIVGSEEFDNAYFYFIEALTVLAAPPDQACEILGNYNVAFEAKYDAEAGPYLFNYESCPFSKAHKKQILELMELLAQIPKEVLSFTNRASESLERMSHPCWIPVRQKANELLGSLSSITKKNRKRIQDRN